MGDSTVDGIKNMTVNTPALLFEDATGKSYIQFMYIGDQEGQMWKMDVRNANPANWPDNCVFLTPLQPTLMNDLLIHLLSFLTIMEKGYGSISAQAISTIQKELQLRWITGSLLSGMIMLVYIMEATAEIAHRRR